MQPTVTRTAEDIALEGRFGRGRQLYGVCSEIQETERSFQRLCLDGSRSYFSDLGFRRLLQPTIDFVSQIQVFQRLRLEEGFEEVHSQHKPEKYPEKYSEIILAICKEMEAYIETKSMRDFFRDVMVDQYMFSRANPKLSKTDDPLILPFQRLQKYPLFFRDLLKKSMDLNEDSLRAKLAVLEGIKGKVTSEKDVFHVLTELGFARSSTLEPLKPADKAKIEQAVQQATDEDGLKNLIKILEKYDFINGNIESRAVIPHTTLKKIKATIGNIDDLVIEINSYQGKVGDTKTFFGADVETAELLIRQKVFFNKAGSLPKDASHKLKKAIQETKPKDILKQLREYGFENATIETATAIKQDHYFSKINAAIREQIREAMGSGPIGATKKKFFWGSSTLDVIDLVNRAIDGATGKIDYTVLKTNLPKLGLSPEQTDQAINAIKVNNLYKPCFELQRIVTTFRDNLKFAIRSMFVTSKRADKESTDFEIAVGKINAFLKTVPGASDQIKPYVKLATEMPAFEVLDLAGSFLQAEVPGKQAIAKYDAVVIEVCKNMQSYFGDKNVQSLFVQAMLHKSDFDKFAENFKLPAPEKLSDFPLQRIQEYKTTLQKMLKNAKELGVSSDAITALDATILQVTEFEQHINEEVLKDNTRKLFSSDKNIAESLVANGVYISSDFDQRKASEAVTAIVAAIKDQTPEKIAAALQKYKFSIDSNKGKAVKTARAIKRAYYFSTINETIRGQIKVAADEIELNLSAATIAGINQAFSEQNASALKEHLISLGFNDTQATDTVNEIKRHMPKFKQEVEMRAKLGSSFGLYQACLDLQTSDDGFCRELSSKIGKIDPTGVLGRRLQPYRRLSRQDSFKALNIAGEFLTLVENKPPNYNAIIRSVCGVMRQHIESTRQHFIDAVVGKSEFDDYFGANQIDQEGLSSLPQQRIDAYKLKLAAMLAEAQKGVPATISEDTAGFLNETLEQVKKFERDIEKERLKDNTKKLFGSTTEEQEIAELLVGKDVILDQTISPEKAVKTAKDIMEAIRQKDKKRLEKSLQKICSKATLLIAESVLKVVAARAQEYPQALQAELPKLQNLFHGSILTQNQNALLEDRVFDSLLESVARVYEVANSKLKSPDFEVVARITVQDKEKVTKAITRLENIKNLEIDIETLIELSEQAKKLPETAGLKQFVNDNINNIKQLLRGLTVDVDSADDEVFKANCTVIQGKLNLVRSLERNSANRSLFIALPSLRTAIQQIPTGEESVLASLRRFADDLLKVREKQLSSYVAPENHESIPKLVRHLQSIRELDLDATLGRLQTNLDKLPNLPLSEEPNLHKFAANNLAELTRWCRELNPNSGVEAFGAAVKKIKAGVAELKALEALVSHATALATQITALQTQIDSLPSNATALRALAEVEVAKWKTKLSSLKTDRTIDADDVEAAKKVVANLKAFNAVEGIKVTVESLAILQAKANSLPEAYGLQAYALASLGKVAKALEELNINDDSSAFSEKVQNINKKLKYVAALEALGTQATELAGCINTLDGMKDIPASQKKEVATLVTGWKQKLQSLKTVPVTVKPPELEEYVSKAKSALERVKAEKVRLVAEESQAAVPKVKVAVVDQEPVSAELKEFSSEVLEDVAQEGSLGQGEEAEHQEKLKALSRRLEHSKATLQSISRDVQKLASSFAEKGRTLLNQQADSTGTLRYLITASKELTIAEQGCNESLNTEIAELEKLSVSIETGEIPVSEKEKPTVLKQINEQTEAAKSVRDKEVRPAIDQAKQGLMKAAKERAVSKKDALSAIRNANIALTKVSDSLTEYLKSREGFWNSFARWRDQYSGKYQVTVSAQNKILQALGGVSKLKEKQIADKEKTIEEYKQAKEDASGLVDKTVDEIKKEDAGNLLGSFWKSK